jgi:hypothetical protein
MKKKTRRRKKEPELHVQDVTTTAAAQSPPPVSVHFPPLSDRFKSRFGDEIVNRYPSGPSGGIVPNLMDVVKWEVYDRVKLFIPEPTVDDTQEQSRVTLYTPRKATLFVYPLGQEGKSLTHTNMLNCGQLPMPNSFMVQSMTAKILEGGRPVDSSCRLWWMSHFDFVMGSKTFLQIPADALLTDPYSFGDMPLEIESGMGFSVTFETEWKCNPERNFEIAVRLSGKLRRAVM